MPWETNKSKICVEKFIDILKNFSIKKRGYFGDLINDALGLMTQDRTW